MSKRLKGGGRRDLELAARFAVAAADVVLGFFVKAQDVDDALEISFARFGQPQMPCGPLEEACAQAVFEKTDSL